jgi:hypothetical protein
MNKIRITESELIQLIIETINEETYLINEKSEGRLVFPDDAKFIKTKTSSSKTTNEPKKEPVKSSSGPVSVNFVDIAKKVINKLEGGYYNPKWHKGSGLGDSGETMFGMDRKHGVDYRNSPEGQRFWKIIDDDKKKKGKKVWHHYYRGGELEQVLTNLASKQIEPRYYQWKKKYLSNDAEKIVDRTPKLIFHFAYACWNGEGFFRLFSKKINKSVEKGITDPDKLVKVALDSRKNFVSSKNEGSTVVIQRGGRKMEEIFKSGLV